MSMENSSGGDSGSLSEESSPPGSSMKRKMVKSDKLYTYIGNIIMADTVQWRMLLTKSGTRGRPDAVAKLQEFLTCNETASELCKDKKVSAQTITNWLNECIQKACTATDRGHYLRILEPNLSRAGPVGQPRRKHIFTHGQTGRNLRKQLLWLIQCGK